MWYKRAVYINAKFIYFFVSFSVGGSFCTKSYFHKFLSKCEIIGFHVVCSKIASVIDDILLNSVDILTDVKDKRFMQLCGFCINLSVC